MYVILNLLKRRCGEMADAQDSKSCEGNLVSVRPRPPAPSKVPKFKRFRDFLLLKCLLQFI